MQAFKGGKQSTLLPSYEYKSNQYSTITLRGYITGTCPLAVANSSLPGIKTHSTKGNSFWYWKSSQLLGDSEVVDLGREPTIDTLLI